MALELKNYVTVVAVFFLNAINVDLKRKMKEKKIDRKENRLCTIFIYFKDF